MKSEANSAIAELLLAINDAEYKSFDALMNLLNYALERDISLYDFIKALNSDYNYQSELKEKGSIIKIDTDAVYNALKESKDNKDDLPRN